MCVLENIQYTCGHYGGTVNSQPCARAIGSAGLTKGCWDATVEGVLRIETKCAACEKLDDLFWHPMKDISPEGQRDIDRCRREADQRERERRIRSQQSENPPFGGGRS